MTMPRLSLYRPQKGNDYKFIDKAAWEMFQVGGVDVLIHKYIGPGGTTTAANSTPTNPYYETNSELHIQDLLFLENRDRKYDPDIYVLRGVYNIQDIDFNLSQFGLFLQNDTIFISFHINDTVEKLGRKISSGDVIELPHLKDDYALNDLTYALKRFFVIEEVSRTAEGYSATWYPHLYRAKCKPIVDSQEFKQILDGVANTDAYQGAWSGTAIYYPGDVVKGPDGKNYTVLADPVAVQWVNGVTYYPNDVVIAPNGQKYTLLDNELTKDGISGVNPPNSAIFELTNVADGITGIEPPNTTYFELADTLRDIMSTYETEMQITEAILNQAELDAPQSGPDTTKLYSLQKTDEGLSELVQIDNDAILASAQTQATDADGNLLFNTDGSPIYVGATASTVFQSADGLKYHGIIYDGDGIPPNGAPFSAGIAFPLSPTEGQYCLRKDYLPHRLFRFNGVRWIKIEDKVRMTMNNLGASDVGPGDRFEGKENRQTLKSSFINNTNQTVINDKLVKERQSLSKALRPEADE